MEQKTRRAGKADVDLSKVPLATETEKGIASIAVNHPDEFVKVTAEKRFSPLDIFHPLSKAVVEVVLSQASRSSECDIRIVFEKVRERLPDTQFHELSDIYTLMPIKGALPEYIQTVRSVAKRRTLMAVLAQANMDISDAQISTAQLLSDISMQADSLSHELAPPSPMDTKKLLMEAIARYETGDDHTERIRTGYNKLDNLTPIRYGDFLVIGGETKSGKTMLALNIICNIICNLSTSPHIVSTSTEKPLSQQGMFPE